MRRVILLMLYALPFAASLRAAGIWTSIGEVRMANLNIGQTYKMSELVGYRMSAQNASDTPMNISMRLEIPPPEQCKKGFEPLPDASWVVLEKESFESVAPKIGGVFTEVFIRIPNDKKLKKRAFQFHIAASGSVPGGNVGVETMSRFLVILGEKEGLVYFDPGASYHFKMEPFDFYLGRLEMGKVHDLYAMGKRFTITNPGKKKARYQLTTQDGLQAQVTIPKQFPDIPGTKFLSYEEDVIEVEPGQKKDVRMYLWIPKDKKYENKNFMFVMNAHTLDAPISYSVHGRVYVSTGKGK